LVSVSIPASIMMPSRTKLIRIPPKKNLLDVDRDVVSLASSYLGQTSFAANQIAGELGLASFLPRRWTILTLSMQSWFR
jgi:hypothetical protein